ncbi:hypothetical protein ABBQ38_004651 [Trebouxia sp. C0009 RCD-2024]
MFSDLPDGCVAYVVGLLHCVQDVLNFKATCTRHAEIVKAQQTKWLDLLHTDYDTRLQASAQIDGQQLYRTLAVSKPRTLRYHGCFTDGGVDEQLAAYWVDNMFTPNHWESYCSHHSSNVNCMGLLLGEDSTDKKWAALRSYMIERLSKPVSWFFDGGDAPQLGLHDPIPAHLMRFEEERLRYLKLVGWSTQGLSHLFLSVYDQLQLGTQLGQMLLHGIAGAAAEMFKLQSVATFLQQNYLRTIKVIHGSQHANHAVLGSHSLKLMKESSSLPQLVGVVERVTICAAGDFSCPLKCGVLFMADCHHLQWGQEADSRILQAFQATVAQQMCREFDDVDSPQVLRDKIKEGRLPAAVAAHLTPQGGWVEFNPSFHPHPPGTQDPSDPTTPPLPLLRPLAWFRLTTAVENAVLEERRIENAHLPHYEDDVAPWWQDLAGPGISQAWRDLQGATEPSTMEACVRQPSDEDDDGDPATSASRLHIRLHRRHGGNMLCIKLINQENLMAEHNDDHPNPNIDVNYIACHGRLLELPKHLHVR